MLAQNNSKAFKMRHAEIHPKCFHASLHRTMVPRGAKMETRMLNDTVWTPKITASAPKTLVHGGDVTWKLDLDTSEPARISAEKLPNQHPQNNKTNVKGTAAWAKPSDSRHPRNLTICTLRQASPLPPAEKWCL